jgi:hypothetical protein
MGSSAHMDQMESVLNAHEQELREETWEDVPEVVRALGPKLEFEAEIDEISRWLVFVGSNGKSEYLALAPLTIFDLEHRYPDEIAY